MRPMRKKLGDAGRGAGAAGTQPTARLVPPLAGDLAPGPHRHVLVVAATGGTATLHDAGGAREVPLRPGAATFLPADSGARLALPAAAEALVVEVAGRAPQVAVADLLDPGLAALGREARRAFMEDPLPRPAYLGALADAMLARLAACHPAGRPGALAPGPLAAVARHVELNLPGEVRVADLAALAGLTRSHFSRAFQAAAGMPPCRFILQRRLWRARGLLAGGGHGVAEAARLSGFSSHAHLTRAFRAAFGVTPNAYRQALRGGV